MFFMIGRSSAPRPEIAAWFVRAIVPDLPPRDARELTDRVARAFNDVSAWSEEAMIRAGLLAAGAPAEFVERLVATTPPEPIDAWGRPRETPTPK
jgi:hypothetical protein